MGRSGQRHFLDQAAPGDVAGIDRLGIGQEKTPYRRTDSIGAYQQVAPLRPTIGEGRSDPVLILFDPAQHLARVEMLGRQNFLQVMPHAIPSGEGLWQPALADHVAALPEGDSRLDFDAELRIDPRARLDERLE